MAYAPSYTSLRIRHRLSESDLWGHIDPLWGIPEQNCPLVRDTDTGLYRPFSSLTTIAEAIANFAGWSNDYVKPGISTTIQIIQHAIVNVELVTPTAVTTWTRVTPVLVSGAVSNYIFTTTDADNADNIGRVWKECACPPAIQVCPPAAAAAGAIGSSGTAAPTRATMRSVEVEFNVLYRSRGALQI